MFDSLGFRLAYRTEAPTGHGVVRRRPRCVLALVTAVLSLAWFAACLTGSAPSVAGDELSYPRRTVAGMKTRSVHRCRECGDESPRWLGRCPSCGEWGTLVEAAPAVAERAGAA